MAVVYPASISLKYAYDQSVEPSNTSFYSGEGFYFTLSNLLSGARDIATNQETLLVLTDNYNFNDKIDNYYEIDKTEIITRSTVSFLSGNTEMYLIAGTTGTAVSATAVLSAATIFNLDFNTVPGAVALSSNGLYLTSSTPGYVTMAAYIPSFYSTYQYFNYTLFNDQVILFTRTGNRVIEISSSNILATSPYISTAFTSAQKFKLNRFYYNSINNKGESNLAKYTTTPNDLTVSTATSALKYNYLLSVPYTTLDETETYANVNVAPLKNYYSPQGVQTPELSTQLRNYNKLYTGLNTKDGFDKIYLSYQGSEITKVFTKDTDTYFHYPVSAANVPLSASTLVKSGALGGSSPWRSDRVFVKKANYRNYSNWGNNPGQQNGTFFCTWLSAGTANGEPVWMDRYYNPSQINLTNVLTSTSFTSAANNWPNIVWDVPSTQTLNPESLYIYHRIGDNDNQVVVNTLSSTLTRHISNWTTPLINEATGLESGTLYNFAASAVGIFPGTRDQYIDTNVSYGVLDFTDGELNNSGITLAFYAYNTDWSNIKGSQLVGNYYSGGIGVSKNNTLLTPFTTIINYQRGELLTTNTGLNTIKYTPVSLSGNNFILKGEYDSSYYIINGDKKLYTFDQDDLNVNTVTLNLSGTLFSAFLIKEQSINQIIVFTKLTNTDIVWRKFNIDGSYSVTGTVSGTSAGYNNCTIDLFGTPVYFNSSSGNGTVDSNNNVFALSGNNLIRKLNTNTSAAILSALSAEYIACDHEDNIWLLYAGRNLCKLSNYGSVIWDVYLTDAPVVTTTSTYSRTINFISEINPSTGSITHSGVIVDPKTQNIFKVSSSNGAILSTKSISGNNISGITKGDITGYDYQRKYIYTEENSNDITVKLFTRGITGAINTEQSLNINYDISYLTPGWHHFAVTVTPNNLLKFYIDGSIVKNVDINATVSGYAGISRVYNNKNNPNMVIGTASFKKQTLAQYTNETTDVYRYDGKIADVRFYTQSLEQSDIKALQKRFSLNSFNDLKWSCPTGQRYYIEQIERFFLHRLPGAKSNMFNIKIKNSNITDPTLRNIVEKNIIASLNKTIPVQTKLNSIIWE